MAHGTTKNNLCREMYLNANGNKVVNNCVLMCMQFKIEHKNRKCLNSSQSFILAFLEIFVHRFCSKCLKEQFISSHSTIL